MTAVKWHTPQPCIAVDTETTGIDPHTARIITAAIIHHTPGRRPHTIQWLINPHIPIPDQAAAIHGWTTNRLHRTLGVHGALRTANRVTRPLTGGPAAAVREIAAQLNTAMHTGAPIVTMNAAYDLTIIDAELTRYGHPTLSSRAGGITGVLDVMVLDKARDPYRRVNGGCACGCGATDKTLLGLCTHYGVRHTGAHDAAADALAALRLVPRIADGWTDTAALSLSAIHMRQIGWRRQQCNSLRRYFDETGVAHDGIPGDWPTIPTPTPAHMEAS